MDNQGDLIAAISTASGPGAVSMIRLSGMDLIPTLKKVFHSKSDLLLNPRKLILGKIVDFRDDTLLDHALAVYFPGPFSFTGEDCAEIQGHGGSFLPRLTLEIILKAGARLARPGEFSERSFLNGRMSLDQAEAVAEIVASVSLSEARIAAKTLDGGLREKIEPLFSSLLTTLSQLTAVLDFEEDWIEDDRITLNSDLSSVKKGLEEVLKLRKDGRIYREGLRVVLAGYPNSGKSRLFNTLLGQKRALVSNIPGTTRDYLLAILNFGAIRVELVDTAGLRTEGQDELELMGQELTMEQIEEADLVVWLHDLSTPSRPMLIESKTTPVMEVWNKLDLAEGQLPDGIKISAATGEGLDELKKGILSILEVSTNKIPELVPNLRQQEALEGAYQSLINAMDALKSGEVPEIAAVLLRESLDQLGAVTGKVFTDDILKEVFKHFCLGK
jgi:tRNA modification GTPase